MSSNFTRRNFMKAAGTTMGVAAAAGISGKASAQSGDKIRVGLIVQDLQRGDDRPDAAAGGQPVAVLSVFAILSVFAVLSVLLLHRGRGNA